MANSTRAVPGIISAGWFLTKLGRRIRAACVVLTFSLSAALTMAQPSSVLRDDVWIPDGPVNAVVETNGVIYVGGLFDYVSPNAVTGGAFDLLSGASVPGFPSFSGVIKVIIADNAGGWFVGGSFTSAGGFPIRNLAHIRADKTVDTDWLPNPDGSVMTLVSSSDLLYVGGTFSSIGGEPRSALAALDPRTGSPMSWRADVSNEFSTAVVTSLVLSDGSLYVGGGFSLINGVAREHVASVDATTGQVTSWSPNSASGASAFVRVDALAISGHVLFVGGTFASLGGQSDKLDRNFLAALDTTSDLADSVLPWNPDANGPISSIVVSCDTVYVSGSFTTIGGTNRNRIAALNIITGQATDWNPDANGDVFKLMQAGNVIYAGGKFTEIGGEARSFLAAVDIDSAQATLWSPRADFGVTGLAVSGGAVVAGGALSPGGKVRKNAAAFDARTGRLLDWNPIVNGSTLINAAPYEGVDMMVAWSNVVYLAGPFTTVNGQPRNHLAAVNGVTGELEPWNPHPDGFVKSMAVSGEAIYVGGIFSAIGGATRTNIAALHPVTGDATSWNPGANDKVTSLSISGGTVYAGGLFTQIGGVPRRRLAALNGESGEALPWDPYVNNQVSTLLARDGRVYVGGHFSKIGAQSVNRLAAVDTDSGEVNCWRPEARYFNDGSQRSAAINAMVASSDVVYAGGTFSEIGGQQRAHLAALSMECSGGATSWDPNLDRSVRALALSQSGVIAGGLFQSVGGVYRPNLAVFPLAGSPTIVDQPRGALVRAGQSVSLSAAATGSGTLSYQWQLNGTNLLGATASTLVIASAQVASSGDYTVVVTNALGLINSRPATVIIVEPLTILAQPVSQTVEPGADVTLSVAATGNPPPIYQWRLNGTDIHGATRPTLTITNAQPTDGGSYSVVVASVGGAVNSDSATLLVRSAPLAFTNNLTDRVMISGVSGLGSGNNADATFEDGETNHVGKLGGRSVWLGWIAPATGIATFGTRGSSFDTLLAIYTGTDVSSLSPLAADEDSGGFLTSRASFNALAGTEYLIAVDGFAGASGNIVLQWSLDTSTVPFPRLLSQPLSLTVTNGGRAEFSVSVSSTNPTTYQWFRECRAIDGATNVTFTITNVQLADVGRYHVEVRNDSSRIARSFDASLDIGPEPKAVAQDKLEDALGGSLVGGIDDPLVPEFTAASVTSGGFISVTAGSIDSHQTDNKKSTRQEGEPNHCDVVGGVSVWLVVQAQSDGAMFIDTMGSAIDTVLAVYRPATMANLAAAVVACDNDGAPDGIRSSVRFDVGRSQKFLVVVDGVNGAKGLIRINWKLGVAPVPSPMPSFLPLLPGTNITLTVTTTNAVPPPTYQWLWNGTPIVGATRSNLTLVNVQSQQAGIYSIIVSNFAGVVIETNAVIEAPRPLQLLSQGVNSDGYFKVKVDGGVLGQVFVLQAATNLSDANWTSLVTTQQPFLFLDTNAPSLRQRFYRAILGP